MGTGRVAVEVEWPRKASFLGRLEGGEGGSPVAPWEKDTCGPCE